MKTSLLSLTAILIFSFTNAQYTTSHQNYYTPISGQALTVIDEDNTQFDSQGNIYTMMDRESIRYSILTCLKNTGAVGWIDTLKLTPYAQSAVGHFRISNNRIYTFSTHGNNLNSSNAEAVALTKLDLNGTQLNQVVLSNSGTNFRSREIYAQPNGKIIITYLTNDAMTNWMLHVDCYDSMLNQKWVKSFPWPVYSPSTMPAAMDNQSNCYITYTIDSIVSGSYYRKAFVHKIDSNGNLQWTKNVYDKRYKFCKIDGAGNLVMAGETIAPYVYVTNNIGDVLVTKWNASNGNQIWETLYNATSSEKEIVLSLDIDASNSIIIGGNQDIQDITSAHYKGFANLYTSSGSLIKTILKPQMEVVYATRFLNSGNPIVRSATSTVMNLNRYNALGNIIDSNQYTFVNGASWAGMDIKSNDDIALAISDQLCADRGVTVMYLGKKFPNGLEETYQKINIVLFPNPVRDLIQIQSDEPILSARCYDVLGIPQILKANSATSFDTHELKTGCYFIDIQTASGIYKTKFIKL